MGQDNNEEAGPSSANIVTPEQLQRASQIYEQGLQHLRVSPCCAMPAKMVIGHCQAAWGQTMILFVCSQMTSKRRWSCWGRHCRHVYLRMEVRSPCLTGPAGPLNIMHFGPVGALGKAHAVTFFWCYRAGGGVRHVLPPLWRRAVLQSPGGERPLRQTPAPGRAQCRAARGGRPKSCACGRCALPVLKSVYRPI